MTRFNSSAAWLVLSPGCVVLVMCGAIENWPVEVYLAVAFGIALLATWAGVRFAR